MPGGKTLKRYWTESYNQVKIQAKEQLQGRIPCLTKVLKGISDVPETLRQPIDISWF